ncbi:CUE domain-containing protein 2 isoform X2 [Hydra vulgaris]|uniref:CUE domain-containing protein 2 isoform X2 n=1 Tax=Hydra vulgaris TaxID=6087 RepID=A0ABM4D4A4_HYDVU
MDKSKSSDIVKDYARNALEKFVFEYTDCDLSCVDEILLEYLVTVLESLGKNSNDVETSFDIDEFTAMMTDFIPGFKNINRDSIINWMFSLAKRIEAGTITLKKNIQTKNELEQVCPEEEKVVVSTNLMSNLLLTETRNMECSNINKKTENSVDIPSNELSSTHLNSQKKISYCDKLQRLKDLYPGIPEDQLRRSLAYAHGNLNKAANAILSNKACQEHNVTQHNNSFEEEDKEKLKIQDTKDPCADLLMKEKVSQLQEIFPFKSVSCLQETLLSIGSIDGACQLLFEQDSKVESYNKLKVHKTSSKKACLSDSDLARLKQDALLKYSLVVEKSEPYKPIVFVEKDSKVEPLNNIKENLFSSEKQSSICQTLTKGKISKINPKANKKSKPP